MRFKKVFLSFLFVAISIGFHAHAEDVIEHGGRTYSVFILQADSDHFAEVINLFNSSLDEHPTTIKTISACEKVVHVPVGFVNGNHSYGGLCSAEHDGKRVRIMICADEMVGHNVVKFSAKLDAQELARFVMLNCFGG